MLPVNIGMSVLVLFVKMRNGEFNAFIIKLPTSQVSLYNPTYFIFQDQLSIVSKAVLKCMLTVKAESQNYDGIKMWAKQLVS